MSTPHPVDMHKAMDKKADEKAFGKTRRSDGLKESDIRILEVGYIERLAHMGALHDLDRLASIILAIVYSGTESLVWGTQEAINQSTVACAIDSNGTLVIATNKVKWQPKVTEEKYDHRHRDPDKYKLTLTRLTEDWKARKIRDLAASGKSVPRVGIPSEELRRLEAEAEKASMHHHHMPHNVDPRPAKEKPAGTILFDPEHELRGILRDISNGLVSDFKLLNRDEGGEFHAEMRLLNYFVERKYRPHLNVIGVSKPCCRFCSFWLLSFGVQISTYHTITPYEWTPPSCSSRWSDGITDLSSPWSERMASPVAVKEYSKKLLSVSGEEEQESVKRICSSWPAPFRPAQ